jgi:hypothetical protein
MRNYVTIVSGVPRSGTSMMMRMLDAGGVPAFTDGQRMPDVHNPHGYFEYGPVKRLAKDTSWIDVTRGKAIKVIYPLLRYLPDRLTYRVVFMARDLVDVVESQRDMLLAASHPAAKQPVELIVKTLSDEVRATQAWLSQQPNFQVLPVRYEGVLENAGFACHLISEFLGGDLNEAGMTAVVDPSLHHKHAASRL